MRLASSEPRACRNALYDTLKEKEPRLWKGTVLSGAITQIVSKFHVGVGMVSALRQRDEMVVRPVVFGHPLPTKVARPTIPLGKDMEVDFFSVLRSLLLCRPQSLPRFASLSDAFRVFSFPLCGGSPRSRRISFSLKVRVLSGFSRRFFGVLKTPLFVLREYLLFIGIVIVAVALLPLCCLFWCLRLFRFVVESKVIRPDFGERIGAKFGAGRLLGALRMPRLPTCRRLPLLLPLSLQPFSISHLIHREGL